jgi:hypothetical protein
MINNALSIVSTITQEIMATSGVPGGATVAQLFSTYQANREKEGREILLKRIAEAQIDVYEAASQDELIGVIYSYMLCSNKGAARINLDLLAQAIAGEMKRDRIYPDKFHKYINVLSSLTRDEILIIGTYIRCYKKFCAEAGNILSLDTTKLSPWYRFMGELVPSSFPTFEHLQVVCGSLIRTGLVTALPPQLGHSPSHAFTILLDEISNLIDFEKAYKEYPDY